MNTKFTLTVIVAAILLTVAACAPAIRRLPILNMDRPAKNDKTTELVPVTGGQAYANEQTYANQKLHSTCASADSQRQNGCQEPALSSGSTVLSGNSSSDPAYLSEQSHSVCASEDKQRQDSCTQ